MNFELMKRLAPIPPKRPLLPQLTTQAELALLCRTLFREGYDDHIAGHISLRQGDGSLLINPWELAWDELCASDIIRVDAAGKVIEGGWNVTPAVGLHLAIYRRRPDVNVIIHNHSRFGNTWANAQRIPPVYDQTSAQVDGDPVLIDEYSMPVNNSAESDRCADAFGQAKWALLANHGVLIAAADIRQAHLRAVTLEWRCRQAWQVEALGSGQAMDPAAAEAMGRLTDGNGFPFLWEAMARRELRRYPEVLG